MKNQMTVFGAYGHTGTFVVSELRRRGWMVVLAGRDAAKLRAAGGGEVRVASVDDAASLDAALRGSSAVINCAGPFLDTAMPLIESAIRCGIPYLDIAAEQQAVLDVFERYANDARAANIVIAPSCAFYGGLGDLMATAAMDDWDHADAIEIAVALDSWHPTPGTRITGQRNPGRRFTFSNGTLERRDLPAGRAWSFPDPFGTQAVVPIAFAETIVISRHLRTPEIRMFLNETPLAELRNPDTPAPEPADESGRSAQTFVMDVIVHRGDEQRRIVARGRDIYAFTAPLVVEAAERIVRGAVKKKGVVAMGEAFDAGDFLRTMGIISQAR